MLDCTNALWHGASSVVPKGWIKNRLTEHIWWAGLSADNTNAPLAHRYPQKVVHALVLRSLPAQTFLFTYSSFKVKIFTFTESTFANIYSGSFWLGFLSGASRRLQKSVWKCKNVCRHLYGCMCQGKTDFSIWWLLLDSVPLSVWGREDCTQHQLDFGFYHTRHW